MEFWKVDTKSSTVRKVQGDPHPGSDSDGDRVYENTHFANEDDAWTRLRGEIEARVKFSSGMVSGARHSLSVQVNRASEANTAMALYIENRDNRQRLNKEQP